MRARFGEIDFLADSNVGKKAKKEPEGSDWANFDFGAPKPTEKPKEGGNLIDFD